MDGEGSTAGSEVTSSIGSTQDLRKRVKGSTADGAAGKATQRTEKLSGEALDEAVKREMQPDYCFFIFLGAFLMATMFLLYNLGHLGNLLVSHSKASSGSSTVTSATGSATSPAAGATLSSRQAVAGGLIFTQDELARFKGGEDESKIYLAILGMVFDVTAGAQYYGPGAGGYSGFAGRDGSRAFITGNFTDEGLVAEVEDFNDDQLSEVFNWLEFYGKTDHYHYVGVLVGPYYDDTGTSTPKLKHLIHRYRRKKKKKKADDATKKKYPSCNTRWEQGVGTRIWCPDGKVLRKFYIDGADEGAAPVCRCVPRKITPEVRKEMLGRLEPYKKCDEYASECRFGPDEIKE